MTTYPLVAACSWPLLLCLNSCCARLRRHGMFHPYAALPMFALPTVPLYLYLPPLWSFLLCPLLPARSPQVCRRCQ